MSKFLWIQSQVSDINLHSPLVQHPCVLCAKHVDVAAVPVGLAPDFAAPVSVQALEHTLFLAVQRLHFSQTPTDAAAVLLVPHRGVVLTYPLLVLMEQVSDAVPDPVH